MSDTVFGQCEHMFGVRRLALGVRTCVTFGVWLYHVNTGSVDIVSDREYAPPIVWLSQVKTSSDDIVSDPKFVPFDV